jgi:hypothetical protein
VLPTFRPVEEKNSAAEEKISSQVISLFEEIWASEKHYFRQYECEKYSISAAELSGHSTSFSDLFDLCGRTIGQLAALLPTMLLNFAAYQIFKTRGGDFWSLSPVSVQKI